MNRTAIACWIWAAGLLVGAVIVARFDTEVIDLFNRAIGPDNWNITHWMLIIESEARLLMSATAAVLIGAGVVIQALAPRQAPASPAAPAAPVYDDGAGRNL